MELSDAETKQVWAIIDKQGRGIAAVCEDARGEYAKKHHTNVERVSLTLALREYLQNHKG